MKIFCICYENMAGQNGGVRQIAEIAKHLQKLGNQVQVCAPLIQRYKGDITFTIKYIPTINIPILRPLSYHLFSPFYLIFYSFIFRPDILLNYAIRFTFIPLLVSKILSCPFIFFINGITEEEFSLRRGRKLLFFLKFFRRINFKFSDKIITVTQILKNDIIGRYNIPSNKVSVIKNGVDIETFKPLDKDKAQEMVGFKENCYYVGYVGGLYLWHGIDYLIKSAPLILKEIPNLKFVIVGKGREEIEKDHLRRGLINLIERLGLVDDVIFAGEVPFSLVPRYINAFDVCIVFFKPVRKDPGDPIKLYEYLACAKPVVASNVEGYGDFIENIGAGISVDSANPKAVAEAIIRLIKDEGLRKEMGRSGRLAIEKEHTWQKRVSHLENLLFEINK